MAHNSLSASIYCLSLGTLNRKMFFLTKRAILYLLTSVSPNTYQTRPIHSAGHQYSLLQR